MAWEKGTFNLTTLEEATILYEENTIDMDGNRIVIALQLDENKKRHEMHIEMEKFVDVVKDLHWQFTLKQHARKGRLIYVHKT